MEQKSFRYFDWIMAMFVAVLLISNVASTKIVDLKFMNLKFDAGTLLFPLVYIFGDVLTEVYGYRKARRVIWAGFFGALLMSVVFLIVGSLPADKEWPFQNDFMNILGFVPRIVLGSLIAYFAGEFSNSFILAKLKIRTKGKHLWLRTIGSTVIGEGIDTIIFCMVAFYGVFPNDLLYSIIISNYIFKCSVEILFTPVTYGVVGFLKKKENIDYYDVGTNFNPFFWKQQVV